MQYDRIQNYAMKCRLYPTKTQQQAIDDALTAIRVFHNCLVYDMWNNGRNLTEKEKKMKDSSKTTELVHFPDLKSALSASYKKELIEQHPIINSCPQAALTTNVGLKADLKKEFGKLPIEYMKPVYYNELHQRTSYTYQEPLSKILPGELTDGKQPNVFRVNLASIGPVKVRGWNKKLRFGDENTDFLNWAVQNPKTMITVIVSRDTVGDYYVVFKVKECLKPFAEHTGQKVGIDVGIKDLVICSDGAKYENRKFKKQEKRHQKLLNRKLSRRWGPSNEEYSAARKKRRSEYKAYAANPEKYAGQEPPKPIQPSKGYLKAKKQHARLNREIGRRRDLWNHEISRRLVEENSYIAVETLNITGMVRNKHLSYALTDAAFGTLLADIQYKAQWHGRIVQEIGKWTPSSKRCSECGYLYSAKDQYHLRPWSLSIRSWTCPECGRKHDRDINAAKNILFYAEEITNQSITA